jgi:glycerol kinase
LTGARKADPHPCPTSSLSIREPPAPAPFSSTRPAPSSPSPSTSSSSFIPSPAGSSTTPTKSSPPSSAAPSKSSPRPARARDLAAIGITNQRETVVVWDRATGKPIHPAIVWQDRRTAAQCKALEESGLGDDVSNRTGLVLDPYFSATKVAWILDHVPGARTRADKGELAFGTIDTWLIWNLTSGHRHVTDVTNASRTLLYNIVKGEWDPELLRIFNIPASHPA